MTTATTITVVEPTIDIPARPKQVDTVLNYYLEAADGGGETVTFVGTAGDKLRKYDQKPVKVTDVRGQEGAFNLETHGFAFQKSPTQLKVGANKDEIRDVGYREAEEILKKATGATYVKAMFHSYRQALWSDAVDMAKNAKDNHQIIPLPVPLMMVHGDQSDRGAVMALLDTLPADEAAKLQKTRWGIINVWRGLETVRRSPLAVCDSRSTPESELRTVRIKLPNVRMADDGTFEEAENLDGDKEICQWAYSPEHRWYYKSEMDPDDVILIKCNDSKKDGRARRCVHTAFDNEYDAGRARHSIEVRCLVFWQDQDPE